VNEVWMMRGLITVIVLQRLKSIDHSLIRSLPMMYSSNSALKTASSSLLNLSSALNSSSFSRILPISS
jgi:hypothetical protein